MTVSPLPTLEEQAAAGEQALNETLAKLEAAGEAGIVTHDRFGPTINPRELRKLEVLEARGCARADVLRHISVTAGTHSEVTYFITALGRLHLAEVRSAAKK
jgi:hypothetical protein